MILYHLEKGLKLIMNKRLILGIVSSLVLVGCQTNDTPDSNQESEVNNELIENDAETDEEANEFDDTSSEETESEAFDLQLVLQHELADEEPLSFNEINENSDEIFFYSPDIDIPMDNNSDDYNTIVQYYNIVENELILGLTSYDQNIEETPILSSSDFEDSIEKYTIKNISVEDKTVTVETESDTFMFTYSNDNQIEDEIGNTYTIYEADINNLLDDYM